MIHIVTVQMTLAKSWADKIFGTSNINFSFTEYYNTYLAVNKSYIVASIDVRGTGVMGVEAMHAINNALGSVEVSDTLTTIR